MDGAVGELVAENATLAKIITWLLRGKVGASSKTMLSWYLDRSSEDAYYPLDGSDFGRCLGFLAAVPAAAEDMSIYAAISPVWARLVGRWEEIKRLYVEETAIENYAMPKTSNLIRMIVSGG
jgi:hypothetical protein